MRKNVIALMLVLPLLFVFIVFSSGNVASLGVTISARGIEILGKPADGALRLDLTTYENDYVLQAEVTPANASDKDYSFHVEEEEGAAFADISIENGRIVARSPGVARVVAVSDDGGFTDSLTVIVGSSKPCDFTLTLEREGGAEVQLEPTATGYAASLASGRYFYRTLVSPSGFTGAELKCTEGFAVIDGALGSIFLPFGGDVKLTATVKDGLKGDIVKEIELSVSQALTSAGFTVNGGGSATLGYPKGTREGSFYVEADAAPAVSPSENLETSSVTQLEEGGRRYRVDLTFAENCEEEFGLTVSVGEASADVTVSFLEFAFEVRSDLPVDSSDSATVLLGSPVTFYAFPVQGMEAKGVSYEWEADAAEGNISLQPNADGSACVVCAENCTSFVLTVRALSADGRYFDISAKEIEVEVVRSVTAVRILGDLDVGLARRTTLAGLAYAGEEEVALKTPLSIAAYDVDRTLEGIADLTVSVSDGRILSFERTEEGILLEPVGTGTATVTVTWDGNASFGAAVGAAVTFNVAHGAVEVKTSPQLYRAAAAGKAIVLGADIKLGTNAFGRTLEESERASMLGSMRSTFNIDFYTSRGLGDEARVKYAIEFKNDVYGNGHTLDAEYFTNVKDGAGVPSADFFRGPLDFVALGDMTSVAGQDNIAFLVRTNGVTLSNLTLLGCSDESLYNEETKENDLSNLNNVGTTLELNASVSLLNCRVRNGRNVVRAYGGNKNGDRYFIDSLSENEGAGNERIKVRIEGCVLSYAREFLLKIGANRALRAGEGVKGTVEPDLLAANGAPYKCQSGAYLNDAYFYEKYVMTDVTLKDSVLETSGLFTVGLESNFAGMMLYGGLETGLDGWKGTGGTSFASVLRLVGDVRLYDWKRLDLVDSSTLIDSPNSSRFSLNIAGMLNFVCGKYPEGYGDILTERDGKQFVHGGIAFYGGGKNYSQLSVGELNEERRDFNEYSVNISVLKEADDDAMRDQGEQLPRAAGTQDFRFYMYGSGSANSYERQLTDKKYEGVKPVPLFP